MARRQSIENHHREADPDRYLKDRNGRWHYQRRVPVHVQHIDPRGMIRISLKTKSKEIARIRRDELEAADSQYWASLAESDEQSPGAVDRYDSAVRRATALGYVYKSASVLADSADRDELVARTLTTGGQGPAITESLLGGAAEPRDSVSEAMEIYLDQIAVQDTKGKSEKQVRSWQKIKRRAVRNFVQVVGDPQLLAVTRDQALSFYNWWMSRVISGEVKPNSANRDYGNMRKLFREYAAWKNIDIVNPFAGLSFEERDRDKVEVPPFSVDWISSKFLAGGHLAGMNDELRHIFLILIETGCRPSEICNIRGKNIHLDAPVPYLAIRHEADRELKADASARDIPLVGVSLAAIKSHPDGFPRYYDKEDSFSAAAGKFLRENDLFESDRHVVYSLRHAFESRMLAADLDFDFRCLMMGHKHERPKYGDRGSMEWRRDQLKKIVLPYDPATI